MRLSVYVSSRALALLTVPWAMCDTYTDHIAHFCIAYNLYAYSFSYIIDNTWSEYCNALIIEPQCYCDKLISKYFRQDSFEGLNFKLFDKYSREVMIGNAIHLTLNCSILTRSNPTFSIVSINATTVETERGGCMHQNFPDLMTHDLLHWVVHNNTTF